MGMAAFSQDFSNKGKDFWIAYANHVRMYTMQAGQQDQMSLYITSDVNTSGVVEIPGIGYSESFTIVANQIKVLKIPDRAFSPSKSGVLPVARACFTDLVDLTPT